jgi:hypothetical protein
LASELPGRLGELLDHFPGSENGAMSRHFAPQARCFEVQSSNQEFFETFAEAGRIGLVGGSSWLDRLIQRNARRVLSGLRRSRWSHAFLFQGKRSDGEHWVIESDLETGWKHNRLGVQENRIDKFFNSQECQYLAVLDLGLQAEEVQRVLSSALELVARRATYSLMEVIGTAMALRRGGGRNRRNRLAKPESMYCSGFVQYVFSQAGLELVPEVHPSLGTPEDLARSPKIAKVYWRRPLEENS